MLSGMYLRLGRVIALGFLLLIFVGCKPEVAPAKKPPPPKVTVAKPTKERVPTYREYTGYLEPVEMVNVRTRVKGFLQKMHFQEGAEVKKGDLLYEIDSR